MELHKLPNDRSLSSRTDFNLFVLDVDDDDSIGENTESESKTPIKSSASSGDLYGDDYDALSASASSP